MRNHFQKKCLRFECTEGNSQKEHLRDFVAKGLVVTLAGKTTSCTFTDGGTGYDIARIVFVSITEVDKGETLEKFSTRLFSSVEDNKSE